MGSAMYFEITKLVLFLLGLACLLMSVVTSVFCLIPAAIFWAIVHCIYRFNNGYPMDGYFDNLDPANFFDYD